MKHRLFFALMPPAEVWPAIGAHAHSHVEHRVANERLHMTLAVTEEREAFSRTEKNRLCALGSEISVQPVAVCLERLSSLGRVLMLAPARAAPALRELQERVRAGMARRDLLMDKKTFNPHVTLSYRYGGAPFASAIAPIAWEAREFVLIDSHVGISRYDVLGRWPLVSAQGSLF